MPPGMGYGNDQLGFFNPTPQGPPGAPTPQNPGGMPSPGQGDPMARDINIIIAGIKKLANSLQMAGDEQFANELDQMANRIKRRQFNREKEIRQASDKGMVAVRSEQL